MQKNNQSEFYSEPTSIFRNAANSHLSTSVGIMLIGGMSLMPNSYNKYPLEHGFVGNLANFDNKSYTNLAIFNTVNSTLETKIRIDEDEDDLLDFVMKPMYVKEFTMKVKSFIIDKSISLNL
ncbi:MAG: hypothetical protein SGJ10_15035 [Bacteroidota bacterium]|nr:hypothetical protein [Bacteroidota bacterium]